MPEEFPYADIVILALIAGFIILRLRSILGQKTGHDNPNFFQPPQQDKPQEKNAGPIIQLSDKSLKARPRVDTDPYLATISDSALMKDISAIKEKDPLFNATSFLEGAKMAFEMVFDAFAKGDKQTLSLLLSPDINNAFMQDMEARDKQETRPETTLLSVAAKEITAIRQNGNMAQLTVRFESEQVTVERGKNGEIISGDPSDVHHVQDEWVFERDVTSKNPNWKIIET